MAIIVSVKKRRLRCRWRFGVWRPSGQAITNRATAAREAFRFGNATLIHGDCFQWLATAQTNSIEAVVTDPPYGLVEYSEIEQNKLRAGRGGVWRIPPSFDGNKRSPLPRFTVLSRDDITELERFFFSWARLLFPVLVPGAHVIVASNPLLSFVVANAVTRAGFERRGEIIRLTMTMRGGDRPKAAHTEFADVSVMPRSMWEPWLIFRKPIEGRVQDNLRRWKTGGFRRPSKDQPFGDVITSAPTRKQERSLAPHPSLKPQAFMRKLCAPSCRSAREQCSIHLQVQDQHLPRQKQSVTAASELKKTRGISMRRCASAAKTQGSEDVAGSL